MRAAYFRGRGRYWKIHPLLYSREYEAVRGEREEDGRGLTYACTPCLDAFTVCGGKFSVYMAGLRTEVESKALAEPSRSVFLVVCRTGGVG